MQALAQLRVSSCIKAGRLKAHLGELFAIAGGQRLIGGRCSYAGWWGHELASRFQMPPVFKPIPGAQGLQQSNPNVLSIASLLGSLQVFEAAGGIRSLRARAVGLTRYLERLLLQSPRYVPAAEAHKYPRNGQPAFTVITPPTDAERGSQLSLLILPESVEGLMDRVFAELLARGVVGDERRPNVIRLTPIALYNRFDDCLQARVALDEALTVVSRIVDSAQL